jgi:hypothetical protein
MKARKTITLHRPGMDAIKDWIRAFIVGRDWIYFKGLSTLNVRRALRLSELDWGCRLTMLIITMQKSRMFHVSLRYECLCKMKPMAPILVTHSMMKTQVKNTSIWAST